MLVQLYCQHTTNIVIMDNTLIEAVRCQSLQRIGLEEIIRQMNDIEVELKWDGKYGEFSESILLDSAGYLLIAEVRVRGRKLHEYAATLEMPEDVEVEYEKPEVNQITVFDTEGDQVHITDRQYTRLVYNIKKNIRIDD